MLPCHWVHGMHPDESTSASIDCLSTRLRGIVEATPRSAGLVASHRPPRAPVGLQVRHHRGTSKTSWPTATPSTWPPSASKTGCSRRATRLVWGGLPACDCLDQELLQPRRAPHIGAAREQNSGIHFQLIRDTSNLDCCSRAWQAQDVSTWPLMREA